MVHPRTGTRSTLPGNKPVLDRAMLSLDQAVAQWVIGRGHVLGDPQHGAELHPEPGHELTATVCDNGGRDAEVENPVMQQSLGSVLGSDG